MNLQYAVQNVPNGLAEAFLIGEQFLGDAPSCLVLGDNIFYGHGLAELLQQAAIQTEGASVFAYRVQDPERYGVIEFDGSGRALSLEEKPKKPKSKYAVTGLYFYDNQVTDIAKSIKPSPRGELEITDVNRFYMGRKCLNVRTLGRGYTWLDTGTHESMLEASQFIATIETRQGLKVACLEEIAYRLGYIDSDRIRQLSTPLKKNGYGRYILSILED